MFGLRDMPFVFVNAFLFAASIFNYFSPAAVSALLMIGAWVVLVPVFLFVYKIPLMEAIAAVVIFNGLQICFALYRDAVISYRRGLDMRLEEDAKAKAGLTADFEKLEGFEKGMKGKELALANLYEVTRLMSASLKFSGIFDIFSLFMKDNFRFRRCDLRIIDWEGLSARPGMAYSVWQDAPEEDRDDASSADELLRFFLGRKAKELYISRDKGADEMDRLGIRNSAVDTFTAIPLLSEERIVAILTVENLPRADLETFAILAIQLALEIKKVLLYETVERLAITDSLTGLCVRRYFNERLAEEIGRSNSYKLKFALLMADIDGFKRCNDTYGHLVGDVILRDISRIIREGVREIDLTARYGGEEFAVLLPEADLSGAVLVAERLRKRIEETAFKAYDENLKLTVSIGIAGYPAHAHDAAAIIEKADEALYEAKRSGKNVVRVCGK